MAPGPLAQVLRQLPTVEDDNLLTAAIPFADAGVYRIGETCALVQSVDFFTPIVDDPATWGRIAAANALSDVYAMGGRPLTALNLVGFPPCLDRQILVEILRGGAEKCAEAGVAVVGGHTVEDDEPKFGLAVTGLVDPARMVSTRGARPGDCLVLTKPLGTGILATALKGGILTEAEIAGAVRGMERLNRAAAETMLDVGVNACTDVTGFGLLGHALELAAASEVLAELDGAALPVYPRVREMAALGLIPAGSHNNRKHYLSRVLEGDKVPPESLDILADPQTSGGLLIAVSADRCDSLRRKLRETGCGDFLVGRIDPGPPGHLRVR